MQSKEILLIRKGNQSMGHPSQISLKTWKVIRAWEQGTRAFCRVLTSFSRLTKPWLFRALTQVTFWIMVIQASMFLKISISVSILKQQEWALNSNQLKTLKNLFCPMLKPPRLQKKGIKYRLDKSNSCPLNCEPNKVRWMLVSQDIQAPPKA